jgi:hypothetical protein
MRKRLTQLLGSVALAVALTAIIATPAMASFGFSELDFTLTNADGTSQTQAGSHPFAVTNTLNFKTLFDPVRGYEVPDELAKDIKVELPPGLVGDPSAVPRCSNADFIDIDFASHHPSCGDSTAVGTILLKLGNPGPAFITTPVYNLVPPPGVAQKLGFVAFLVPIVIEFTVNPEPPYNVIAWVQKTNQTVPFYSSELTVWGSPADPRHDPFRGSCTISSLQPAPEAGNQTGATCPANVAEAPFLTAPRACTGPLPTTFEVNSWETPSVFAKESILTHDNAAPPNPQGMNGCAKLNFKPSIESQPTTRAASSPTGLDFNLDVHDEGLTSPSGLAQSDIKKTVVTLPEGMSINPSIAEGLNVCTEADLARETAFSDAGAGCPSASKIGTAEVETPLLDEKVNGSLFIAKPYENPFNSLTAMYLVIKNPIQGIIVKQPLNVIPDPVTGRLTTVAENMPQLPFSHFKLHFREGARSPLASPPGCGTYDVKAEMTPWAGGPPVTTTSAFQIIAGPESKPCPTGGLPPFKPGLIAGTLNNAAGRFSPFNVRLFRDDSEQEITHFSIKLPPGVVGKLAGIPFCSDAAIAAAKARTGPHGGQEELDSPSCPAASQIGHSLVGSGVGSALAYAPGKLYLAGPYNGSALSLVAITAGKVGPFDLGTVVVREAFKINPETAEVFLDATGSDPIPHIIKGIPVHLRDIRAYTDRPNFVLNPTSCKRTSTASTLLGSGLDFGSEADDRPVTVSTPFQAADCAALPFKPRLSLQLKGGTKRGAHPALKATLNMNGIGEAGIAEAQVILPKSEFIENAHFNTICTRVQFKQGIHPGEKCPAGSIYGSVSARTPLLDEPLTGPIFLRSSEHQLPDVVAAVHNGQIDVTLVGRVDSVKGRLRSTFETTPDAPVTSATFSFQGAKKGLFVNSTDLCKGSHKAEANFTGQNGKEWDIKPEVKATGCGKARKGKAKKQKRKAG